MDEKVPSVEKVAQEIQIGKED